MGEFYQTHKVRKILSRLNPYTKVVANQSGSNTGNNIEGRGNSMLKDREHSVL